MSIIVSFEGPDAVGKETQAKMLRDFYNNQNIISNNRETLGYCPIVVSLKTQLNNVTYFNNYGGSGPPGICIIEQNNDIDFIHANNNPDVLNISNLIITNSIFNNKTIDYNAGFEYYTKGEAVILRGGVAPNLMFSVGIGIKLQYIHLDYAFLQPSIHIPFKSTQIISIGIPIKSLGQIKRKIAS